MATLLHRADSSFTLVLPITPRGQGRPQFSRTANGVRTYTPTATREAQAEVRMLWLLAGQPVVPPDTPFTAKVHATFARPPSHVGKTGLTAAGRRSVLPRPDVDNIAKLILDALQGLAFSDDLWCRSLTVSKAWGDADEVCVALGW